ncbi:MAG: hypothetical protein KIT36_22065 [Alphaproteobacteria bacterium]|nr:hypothetical protein [Alphaproteobacteria bacterium]
MLATLVSGLLAGGAALAGERFVGRASGGGADCVAVMLELAIDGTRVGGGGTLAVTSQTPVTISGTRAGNELRFVVEHRARVGDDRLQRIPMLGKFLGADRLEVWQDRDSRTCNPPRRGILVRQ